ncbi:MAG: YraN family protein [Chloroflexi bacterium]|nr:YraN family protein [Chloroflexota bacterium]GIW11653.1 MAG: UPF0102 protein [Dehalococcoidia bacterium]
MERQRFGTASEALAARWLEQAGLRILARNVRYPEGEIDLVAEEQGVLVFVEVRARQSTRFGTPEESLTARKQARLRAAAERYLAAHGQSEVDWRIDLVAVLSDRSGRPPQVTHYRAAVTA